MYCTLLSLKINVSVLSGRGLHRSSILNSTPHRAGVKPTWSISNPFTSIIKICSHTVFWLLLLCVSFTSFASLCLSEMVESMKKVASMDVELTVEERNLLSVAYKNVIGARRASWRIISSLEQKEENKGGEDKLKMIREYRKTVRDCHKHTSLPTGCFHWLLAVWDCESESGFIAK